MTDFTILSKPRIHEDTFRYFLHHRHSPAAPEGHEAYARIVSHGVDPALALAVFQHESSFGRFGAAVSHRNWGNIRHAAGFKTEDGFACYPSWSVAAGDAARLLAVYGRNQIRPPRKTSTARTFPHVWAPSSDGNRPTRYGRAIVAAMREYIAEDRRRHPGQATPDEGDRGDDHGGHPGPHTSDGSPTLTVYVSILNRSRIRARPRLDASTLRVVSTGVRATVDRVRTGSPYEVNGAHADTWLRIRAINDVVLPRPVFSASLLWARQGDG